MIRRPTILELQPRRYRIADTRFVPIGQDIRPAGMALIATALAAFVFLDMDFTRDALLPTMFLTLGILGMVIVARAPLWPQRHTLLELNLSDGLFTAPLEAHNGSGATTQELRIDEVDELLFAMRESPVDPSNPRSIKVDAFATYIRMFDGELIPVVEASLDQERTFRVARFLASAFDVGIKQVGKGWRSPLRS